MSLRQIEYRGFSLEPGMTDMLLIGSAYVDDACGVSDDVFEEIDHDVCLSLGGRMDECESWNRSCLDKKDRWRALAFQI